MKWTRGLSALAVAICALIAVLIGCAGQSAVTPPTGALPSDKLIFPNSDGTWVPAHMAAGRVPAETGTVEVTGVGRFSFQPVNVRTLRPDIFVDGHFSLFDALVHIHELGHIDLEYRFDEGLATHVIDSIGGQPHWWYVAHYSSGWWENSVLPMDLYPWKDGTAARVQPVTESYMSRIHLAFEQEVQRLAANEGRVIIPEVVIDDPTGTKVFRDVHVTPHGVRPDVLQNGVITALDILLSLGEQGQLSTVGLTWYSAIGRADPVDNYFVERIDDAEALQRCGYVYEVGPAEFSGFQGTHIHVATDVRVLVSPDYALWFWLCL
jgi:hypothetical protein